MSCLSCGAGEDSVRQQGDQTCQNQYWISTWRTDAEAGTQILSPPDAKNWPIGKDPDAGKEWRQEEKGMTEDEMVGWHHQLDGHEFEQALGIGDGQGSLACCSPWGHKESDTTERLNWTESVSTLRTENVTVLSKGNLGQTWKIDERRQKQVLEKQTSSICLWQTDQLPPSLHYVFLFCYWNPDFIWGCNVPAPGNRSWSVQMLARICVPTCSPPLQWEREKDGTAILPQVSTCIIHCVHPYGNSHFNSTSTLKEDSIRLWL